MTRTQVADPPRLSHDDRYGRIAEMLANDRCVVLDGAVGTELIAVSGQRPEVEEHLWGVTAILEQPDHVEEVHLRYVDAGCDVLSTDTWGLAYRAPRRQRRSCSASSHPVHWMDIARGVRLARRAADEAGRGAECAVALSVNGDIDSADGLETIRLLGARLRGRPAGPDPDGDAVARARLDLRDGRGAARDRPAGLAQFPALPPWRMRRLRRALGWPRGRQLRACRSPLRGDGRRRGPDQLRPARPRAGDGLRGCATSPTCRSASTPISATSRPAGGAPRRRSAAREYAELALCVARGGRSDRRRLLRRWARARGRRARGPRRHEAWHQARRRARRTRRATLAPGRRPPGRAGSTRAAEPLFPLDFPDLVVEQGVFVPTQGSFLVWKYLFRESVGAHQRCLDVGCGTGLLTIQLALNGAAHVHAIDIDHGGRLEHADQRLPERRGRSRQRGAPSISFPGCRGALRRGRREPLPDAGRPVRAGCPPIARSTTGAATCSTT